MLNWLRPTYQWGCFLQGCAHTEWKARTIINHMVDMGKWHHGIIISFFSFFSCNDKCFSKKVNNLFTVTCNINVPWLTNQTHTAKFRRATSAVLWAHYSPASVRTFINGIFISMAVQVRQPHSFCSMIGRCAFTVWEPVLHWWSLTQLSTYHFRWPVCQIVHRTNRSPRAIVLDLHVTGVWCVHSE